MSTPALELEQLLARARERTPDLKDFGTDNYREALTVLLQALTGEARLSAIGTELMAERLVGQLANRLVLEDSFARQPEIGDIAIDDPLVIVGLPRTGTTMLQRVLAVDPRFYSCAWWETRYPVPLPGESLAAPSLRISQAKAEVEQMIAAIPQIMAIHPLDAMLCDEEFMLMEHSFLCAMDAYADVPSYTAWLDQQDQRPVYRQLKRMLQFLQWQKQQRGESPAATRWLLKAPQHLHTLELLLAEFPRAQIIFTHREPAQTIPSMASMAYTLWQLYSADPDPLAAGRQWNERMARGMRHTLAVRAANDPTRFLDIDFADTVARPLEVLERVYAFAGLAFDAAQRQAAETWIKANRRDQRASHDYSLAQFGLSEAQLESDYAAYRAAHLRSPAQA